MEQNEAVPEPEGSKGPADPSGPSLSFGATDMSPTLDCIWEWD